MQTELCQIIDENFQGVAKLKTGEFFDSTYENWRGNYEQMDDVVLIGVEV